MKLNNQKDRLLSMIRLGKPMTLGDQARLVLSLATPAILAQLTTTMMQYIDASMVGSMGPEASAAIGLIETTTWLMGSLCSATAAGFYVQVSHQLGADDAVQARSTLRQGIMSVLMVSALIGLVALAISPFLPSWLGGNDSINATSSAYFAIIAVALPAFQFSMFSQGMLRSSGNMLVPSIMSVVMMSLDVVFNFFLIFHTRTVDVLGMSLTLPGAGMGVVGAAIGTASAELVAASITMYILCFRSKELSLRIDRGRFLPTWQVVKRALHIGLPMGIQQTIMTSAYIVTTIIIAPLGTFAIAANSFGIIVESLCYICVAQRRTGHGHYDIDGRSDVRRSAVCHVHDDAFARSASARSGSAAHRGVRRTYVRCRHHLLRSVCGCRQDRSSERDEPHIDVGCAHHACRHARSVDGTAWRMARHVPRTDVQGSYIPR